MPFGCRAVVHTTLDEGGCRLLRGSCPAVVAVGWLTSFKPANLGKAARHLITREGDSAESTDAIVHRIVERRAFAHERTRTTHARLPTARPVLALLMSRLARLPCELS